MAQVEQMDIDDIESDFDNKENTFHHSNVPSRTPCTEKGYEELDVSELNMKLRYSMTPTASPMSKSFAGPYLDNRNSNPVEDYLNNTVGLENCNLTRSLNSTLTKTENIVKVKAPLQTIATDPLVDSYRISSMRRQSDATNDNMTITVSNANDIDENLSLPSTCSSVVVTPEATTPTKETPKSEGSPILRGLKSVLSMFRPSQSPIPPADDSSQKQEILSPVDSLTTPQNNNSGFCNLASTPVSDKQKETLRSSPLKESIVFNEDLEKELLWNDETTIIFKDEKIPVHKLFFQNPLPSVLSKNPKGSTHINTTVEYMDISCDESILEPKTTKEIDSNSDTTKKEAAVESDNEFLDCETTIIKDESHVSDYNEMECEKEIQTRDLPDDGSSTINESMCQKVLNDADCSKPSEGSSNQTLQIQGITYLESHVTENNSYPTTKISSEKAVTFANSETEGSLHTTLDQSSEIKSGTASEMVGNNHLTSVESSDAATENITDSTLKNGNMVCNNFINEPGSLLAQNKNGNSLSEYQVTNDGKINVKEPIDVKLIDNEGQFDKLEAHPHHACEIINNLPPAEFNDTVDDKHHKIVFEELTVVVNSTDVYADSLNNCDYSEGAFEGNACYESLQVINHSPGVEDVTLTKNAFDCNNEIKKIETVNIAESSMKQIESNLMNLENNFKNDILVDMCSKITMDIECLKESAFIPQNLESNPSILINPYSMVNSEDHSPNMLVQNIADNNRSKELNDNAEENIPCSLEPTLTSTTTVPNDENHINVCEGNIGTATLCKITSIESQNNTEVSATCVVLDNDHDINELTTGKEMTHQITSSQTLLPNNDVSIQNIAEPDTAEYKEAVNIGDVTFEISEKMDFENIDSSSIKNEIKRKSVVHLIPQHDTKTNEDKTSGQDEVIEVEVCKENITHYETNKNIEIPDVRFAQQQENLLQYRFEDDRAEICKKNVISECQSSAKIHSEKGTVLESVGRDNIPIQTIFVKTNNSGDITDFKMLENTTSVKKNIQQSMSGTEVGEIITSANNSPYVSVINPDRDVTETLHEPLEKIDSSFVTNNIIESSPISPKIVSKGYNYNFDEMDDPFATKTKVRTSPTPNSPDQSSFAYDNDIKILEVPKKIDNRRKSQSDKTRLTSKKNSSNSTKLNGRKNIPDRNNHPINRPQDNNISCMPAKENPGKNVRKDNNEADSINLVSKDHIHETQVLNEGSKCPKQDNNISCMETPAKENPGENVRKVNNEADSINQDSKDQIHETQKLNEGSKCLKQEGEGVMNRFKNVFNLPEIDDINFNPFATKSKMCEYSPPPTDKPLKTIESASTNPPLLLQEQQSVNYTTAINEFSFDKDITKDLSPNTSDATSTSKNSNDENTTVREVLTEDEDTLEGPFLESEDLKETDKLTDVNVDPDMINFDDVIQDRDDEFGNNEIFIDAQTFEFLLNKKSTTVLDSGKESLFLKFDPLFAKRVSSDGVLAALSQAHKRQSTPNKVTKPKEHTKTKENTNIENPVAGPSNISENEFLFVECNEDLSSTNTKPVMVVNPAVSSGVSQRKSNVTPNLNRRSLSFTSPAMAVIDRLISLSGNSSILDQNSSLANVSAENIPDTNSAITHLREMLAEKEINVQNMRSESKELKNRLAALEVQVKHLEKESTERLHKINELNERLSEKSKINKSMTTVVEEYEKTIASLISDTEQDKKRHAEERMRLMKERDEQTAHLTNMEVSFNDLHSKYEKSKQIILGYKANEDMYKKTIKEFEGNFAKMQNNYELLKQHATSKLNHANQELEKINRSHEAEVLKYNAMIKRKDMDISSLEETLAQKTKTNKELTAICDELINKVGR